MSDEFEDRIRTHLAGKAAQVVADPDPGGLIERSVGRSRRVPRLVGAAVVSVVLAGSGVLTGFNLAGSAPSASPSTTTPAEATPNEGRSPLAQGQSGTESPPSVAAPAAYAHLFTRTTTSGVTIRVYSSGSASSGGCTPAAPCPPIGRVPTPTPCPGSGPCAQPLVTPQAQGGNATGGGASAGGSASSGPAVTLPGPAVTLPGTSSTQPGSSGSSGSSGTTGTGTVTTSPPQTYDGCTQLVVELSTAKAVGTGSVPRPSGAAPSPNTVQILGQSSFGTAEKAPVSWVAVWVGSSVASVRLTSGATTVDTMIPRGGIAVMAVPGVPTLAGAKVTGTDKSGSVVTTVQADGVLGSVTTSGCVVEPAKPVPTPSTVANSDSTTGTTKVG